MKSAALDPAKLRLVVRSIYETRPTDAKSAVGSFPRGPTNRNVLSIAECASRGDGPEKMRATPAL
jgi:hypothetical protein